MYYFYKKYNVSVGGGFFTPPRAPAGPSPICWGRGFGPGGEIFLKRLINKKKFF